MSTDGLADASVTSVSGGRSSAYMAIHYPTDFYVFAVVLTKDPAAKIKDAGLLRAIREKCPEFEGSRELDQTLINMLWLEQELGKEITWVWGKPFDDVIRDRKALPNERMRFCTVEAKLVPIYQWVEQTFDLPDETPQMHLGFRADEPRRVFKAIGGKEIKGGWDWEKLGGCEQIPGKTRRKEWRYVQCPMWSDGIMKHDVHTYWERRGILFPEVSNCDYCPFHRQTEHRSQYALHPERASWWIAQELSVGSTFGSRKVKTDAGWARKPWPLVEIIKNRKVSDEGQEELLLDCACTD
jgi:hypothetical protein